MDTDALYEGLASESYRAFSERISKDTSYPVKGVRIPDLRKLAKTIGDASFPIKYHEDAILRGLQIGGWKKPFQEKAAALEDLFPYMTAWDHSDAAASSLNIRKGEENEALGYFLPLLEDNRVFVRRTAIVFLMSHRKLYDRKMLLDAIKAYGGTVIFVSHDRHFIRNLATRILYLSEDGPEFFDGDYEYFEYKIAEKEARFQINREKAPEAKSQGALSHEESKQRRNRIKALEREVGRLSEELDSLSSEMAGIDEDIAKPENYSVPSKISSLMDAKKELERRIAEKEDEWLMKSTELEEMNGTDN